MAGYILADLDLFRRAWHTSHPGEPLPKSFQFKWLATRPGCYRIAQIYVGRANYRAVLLFVHDGSKAYIIDTFKKTKDKNTNEVDAAIDRAAKLWEALETNQSQDRRRLPP
jgi:hypothetical protein